jgi:O-antigen ligase
MFKNYDGWAWYAFMLGFALPISTALTSIMAAVAIIWAATHPRACLDGWIEHRHEPVFLAVLFFLIVVVAGVPIALAHGYYPWKILGKHIQLILFFLLLGLLRAPERRQAVFMGFGVAMLISLLASLFAAGTGLQFLQVTPGDYNVFLNHSEHNVFLSLACLGLASLIVQRTRQERGYWLGWLLVGLAGYDIMSLVVGRTGQIVFLLLVSLFLLVSLRRWARVFALAGLVTVVALAALTGQSAIHRGIEKADQDVAAYSQGRAETSVGLRLAMHENAWQLIKARPLLGYGTGGYFPAYAAYTKAHGTETSITTNPHSDYLFHWVENGLPGLLAVVGLYLAMTWTAWRKAGLHGLWLAALTLAWAIPSLANSVLLDHTSGFAFTTLLAALLAGPLPFSSAQERLAEN